VQHPRSPLGAGQVSGDRASVDLEAVPHSREQSIELAVAEIYFGRKELADTGLVDAAEARQFGLGRARFAHCRPQHFATVSHPSTIAVFAIAPRVPNRRPLVAGLR
jgi:hypothetical protein